MTGIRHTAAGLVAVLFGVAATLNCAGTIAQEGGTTAPSAFESDYLDSLRNARDALMSGGDFTAALDPAEIVVRELQASDDGSAIADRVLLAVIRSELARYDEAEAGFLEVVDLLQSDEGQNSETLITPLRLLGRSYIRAGRHPQAVTALTQARAISRRTAGLFNVEHQIGVIDDLTNAHLGLGDTATARDLQIERLETAQRQFGTEDLRVIPYYYEYADYLERSRLRQSAREQYAAALEIAQSHGDTAQSLSALSNIVRQDLHAGSGTASIEQLRELTRAPQTDDNLQELGTAFAVLGDAALIDEDPAVAATHYAQAWELIAAAGEVDPAAYFADPAIIRLVAPLSQVDVAARSLPYSWGTIELTFDVGSNGRVEDGIDVSSQPAELMDEAYVERLRGAWFRPTLVAGTAVAATGVVFTHYFRFYVDPEVSTD